MALRQHTQSRLYNWKFASAWDDVVADDTGVTPQEKVLIGSLAEAFGNPGYFTGNLAVIVEIALEHIGIDPEKS